MALITCPQCQASLKLPPALPPNSAVSCGNCRLKFVPPQAAAGPRAGGGGRWLLLAAALAIGAGGGAFAWNRLSDMRREAGQADKNPPAVAEAPQTTKSQETVTPLDKSGENEEQAPGKSGPSKSDPGANVPPPNPGASAPATKAPGDTLPETPPTPKNKPAPKTYAETKQTPLLDVPPVPAAPAAKPQPKPAAENAKPVENPKPVENAKPAAAAPHPKQELINDAIDKGIAFLKKAQTAHGSWVEPFPNAPTPYSVGYAAIGGLTLLECQVPPDDPALQRAAAHVRSTPIIGPAHRNYEMASAVLFLDRLGNPKDRPLIQKYALQLVAGQSSQGGWSYNSPELTPGELQQLLVFLEATRLPSADLDKGLSNADPGSLDDPLQGAADKGKSAESNNAEPKKSAGPPKKAATARRKPALPPVKSLSPRVLQLPLVHQHYFGRPPQQQPAVPAPAPNLPLQLPMAGVNPPMMPMMGMMMPDDNSNAQFALLALWAARRHGVPTERSLLAAAQRFEASQNLDGGWGYTGKGGFVQVVGSTPAMTGAGLLGLAMGHAVTPPAKDAPAGKLPEQPAIVRGLQKLGLHVDGREMNNLYFLWTLERVGVLYNLKLIGGHDWYDASVNFLLPLQGADGSWSVYGYQGSTPQLDTCFALLVLKRSNLVQDLTERLPLLMSIPDRTPQPNR